MNYKRSILIALAVYFATLVVGGIVSASMGIQMTDVTAIPMNVWIISAVLAAVFSAAGAFWYFKGKNTNPSTETGFKFGLIMVISGFILDFLMFLPLASQGKNPLTELGKYYSQPIFWVTLLLVLAGATGMGMWLQKKK